MKNIIFWGSPEFSLPALEAVYKLGLVRAVITKADKPQGRGLRPEACPVATQAMALGLPLLTPTKLDADFIQQLKKFLPATFLIVAYGKIIPQTILDLSELPSLNIHPSLLPKYRGPSPIQTALLNGDKQTGISLMQLDAEMDHGPIISQETISIESNDYLPQLHDKLAQASAKLLQSQLLPYLEGKTSGQEQDHRQASYCKLITKEDGLIDWSLSAETIRNKIRAYTPWPSCYFTWQEKLIKITAANVTAAEEKNKPGFLYQTNNKLLINCGQGALEILKLQLEGKKEMTAKEFINGYKVA